MQILKTFVAFLILIFIHQTVSAASVNPLVNKFISAVQSNDKQQVNLATDELAANLDAQTELKKNWPDYFILFNFYRLANRIKDLKNSYGGASATAVSSIIRPGSSKGLQTNRDRVFSKNISNRIAARQRNYLSNQESVRRTSNEDRESNQDRIRKRR